MSDWDVSDDRVLDEATPVDDDERVDDDTADLAGAVEVPLDVPVTDALDQAAEIDLDDERR